MAASATVTISGVVSGLPQGNVSIGPVSTTSVAPCAQVTQIVLQAGDNTITLPTAVAPTGCVIQLPAANTSVTKLKGAGADTGIAIGKISSQLLTWDSTAPPASFILNSVSTQTGLVTTVTFF